MPKQSQVGKSFDRILDLVIATGSGSKLPPQDLLAQKLGVSRTVVREAITVLRFFNVVSIRPKSGTLINPVTEWKTVNHEVIEWQRRAGATVS